MFGDGAVNRGPFLEGLNWAALYRLPVLFVCEDNGVAAFTRADTVTAGEGAARARGKPAAYRATSVDGNDVIAVDEVVAAAVAAVRRGHGPAVRAGAHLPLHGPHLDRCRRLAPGGRGRGRARARADRAPRAGLVEARRCRGESLAAISAQAAEEIEAAREAARSAPWPEPVRAFNDVQDTGAVAWRAVTLLEATRLAVRAGDAARPARLGARRGRRPRRPLGPVQGLSGGVRAGARRLHADLGGDHHGRRARRRAGRHAPDHRDAHLRFRDVRDGRARQPDRQGPLHVRRPGEAGRGGAHAARHVAQLGRAAFADAGGVVRAHARRGRGDARRRAADAAGLLVASDPLRRPGAVLRSEGSLGRDTARLASRSSRSRSARRARCAKAMPRRSSPGRRRCRS